MSLQSSIEENTSNISLDIKEEDDVVDPWNVQSKSQTGVDYDKLIRKYCQI